MTWEARMAERAKARQPRAALADQIAHEQGDPSRGNHIWVGSVLGVRRCRYCDAESRGMPSLILEGDGTVTTE